MRGTRGGLLALALGLTLLAVVGNGGAKTTAPDLLLLDPIGAFDHPTFVTSPPGDESRLFVVQQGGIIKLVKSTGTTDVHDRSERARTTAASAACSRWPSRPTTRRAASSTSTTRTTRTATSRWTSSIGTRPIRTSATPSTRRAVITVPHPGQANHNGGQLAVRARRDALHGHRATAAAAAIRSGRARTSRSCAGRSCASTRARTGRTRTPCRPTTRSWARRRGSRRSGRTASATRGASRSTASTANFILGDVGQNTWEEIDYRPIDMGWGRGVNFGWSCMEARHLYGNCPEPPNHTPPVYEYNHNIGGCSITGGYVGRDQEVPSLLGRYVYADYCAGKIWSNLLGIPDATDNREETDIPISLDRPRSARTRAATCTSWARAAGTTCSGSGSRIRPGSSARRSTTCRS